MRISTPQTPPGSAQGFTLIELMVTITVLAILLSLAVPSFSEIIRNNRTAEQANALIVALNLARSEASKQGLPVTVCASADSSATACASATTNNWGNGWLVFADRTGAGTLDAGETILQTSRPLTSGLQLTSGNIGFVRFGASGTLTNPAAITFALQHQSCTGNNRREMAVDRTGRINLAKKACA